MLEWGHVIVIGEHDSEAECISSMQVTNNHEEFKPEEVCLIDTLIKAHVDQLMEKH